MSAVSFNTQQQQAINEYRQSNNLGYVISDEAIVQQMINNGKLPACFGALGQSATPTSKPPEQSTQPNSASTESVFNNSFVPKPQVTQTQNPTPAAESNPSEPPKTQEEIAEEKRNAELKTLGLQNNKGAGTQLKTSNGKIYTVVGESTNGRRIIQDEEGNLQILSHDNKFLDKDYVIRSNQADTIRSNPKIARNETVNILGEQIQNAQKAFDNQMAEDGWAGDVADGISVLWGSENRASKVREDLSEYNTSLAALKEAAGKGDNEYKAAFKEMFGVDYDADAVANYVKTPNGENYEKAFGTKNNIGQRVAKYNESQQTGAAAVKTTAKVGAGIAIGVATGGAGLAAVGAVAAGTAAASAAIDTSDRMSSDVGLKEGELGEILENAAWDGASVVAGGVVGKVAGTAIRGAGKTAAVGRAAVNTAGDVAMGTAQEYAQTGEVTAGGVAANAALGGIGIAAEAGAFKKAGTTVKKVLGGADENSNNVNNLYDAKGNEIAGGFFSKSAPKTVDLTLDKGWQNFKTNNGEITLVNADGKIYFGEVGKGNHTKQIKLNAGESRLLGNSPDGSAIILERNPQGAYSVKHIKSGDSPSFMQRLFGSKNNDAPANLRPATSQPPQVSDKQINKKLQTNFKKINANSGDPGTAVVSRKLSQANDTALIVRELDENFNLANISSQVKPGDVCAVGTGKNQKLYVNNNGTAVELKLSKEKFEELFPQNGFGMVEQNGLNNCWLVSRLNSMTESAAGRAQLYSLLEETPTGDIIVRLKNAKPITFPAGKPASAVKTNLGEGASPGLEMIEQAVLVRYLQNPTERVGDISRLNLSSLNAEANSLSHSDYEAVSSLMGGSAKNIRPSNPNYRTEFKDAMDSFQSGQDMGVITWGAHARSIVSVDPKSNMITYHDPDYAGVDITCSFDELLAKQPSLSVKKAPPPQTSATQAQTIAASKTTISNPNQHPQSHKPPASSKIPTGYREGGRIGGSRTIVGPNKELFIESPEGWQPINSYARNANIDFENF